jgi:hypothetical protein
MLGGAGCARATSRRRAAPGDIFQPRRLTAARPAL